MAISLNNHESRITALEKKTSASGFIQTDLFTNSSGLSIPRSDYNLTLGQGMSKFDALYFVMGFNNTRDNPNTTTVLTSTFSLGKTLDIYQGGDMASGVQRRAYCTKMSDTVLKLRAYDTDWKMFSIKGLIFSKVILYYFSNIIKTLKIILCIIFTNSHQRQNFQEKGGVNLMAISLKNVDDRLRKLESGTSGKLTITKLWSGPGSWSGYRTIHLKSPITDFDFVCFVVKELSTSTWHRNYHMVPSKVIVTTGLSAIGNPVSGDANSGISFEWKGSSQIIEKYCKNNWDGFLEIYGLKIYYIFRYNIHKLKYHYVIFQDWIKSSLKFTSLNQI